MVIYRFERDGLGPYVRGAGLKNGSFFRFPQNTRTYKKYTHLFNQFANSMSKEERYNAWARAHCDKGYMYGCKSKVQLRAYFSGQFKDLFKQGFRIKRYVVPDKEVIDMGVEVAFPVKYHKLQTIKKVNEKWGLT